MIRFLHKLELRSIERLRSESNRRRMLTTNYVLLILWAVVAFLGIRMWSAGQSDLIATQTASSVTTGLLLVIISFAGLVSTRSEINLIYLAESLQKHEADRVAA